MAARKRGRGNGDVRDLTVEILKGIRNELVGIREQTAQLQVEIVQLREEMGMEVRMLREENHATRREMVKGFHSVNRRIDQVTQRVDHLVELSGERWRDHEGRLRKIEKHLEIA